MNAVTSTALDGAYLADAIADELAIAKLLGYIHVVVPAQVTPTCTIFGAKGRSFASNSGPRTAPETKVWVPKWRRAWEGAGELIGPCQLQILTEPTCVTVMSSWLEVFAKHADHPTNDDAIRFAICKAAIAYLNASAGSEP